ncbi:MAG TPA: hypothetical protein VFD00_05880 [Thermoclostridium sp.]|nr:hypothetical protein [Thermoclostridium sp.]
MRRIAMIRAYDKEDGQKIYFEMNEKTFEVTSSIGDEVMYGNIPTSEEEADELLRDLYRGWLTFEFIN